MTDAETKTKPKSRAKAAKTETHAFSAEIARVLKLMIHSLYTNKDIFLRELISNASDACDKLRYQAVTEPAILGEDSELKITLSADEKANTVTLRDNGIGMDHDDLVHNLGTIAKSGTAEFLEQLASESSQKEKESGSSRRSASEGGSGDAKKDTSLIGQFGVGFYSSFMVADRVVVKSRKAGDKQAWAWESAGEGEFTVARLDEDFARGTEITLHLRKDAKKYADKHKLSFIAQTYSDHISFPIEFTDEKGEIAQLNKAAALWTRPQSEITPEQYQEFYNHVAHQPDEPWLTLHNRLEGKISYTNLLFIPSMRPFDLFNQERRRRVKLYVKRVFITDENAEIVPAYLRFLRGVVDSEDLPLNISRETLQDNPLIDKIRESITKKVLGELKKKAEKAPEEYAKFWKNFGAVLKEGLCEMIAPKEKILEACWFHSTAENKPEGYTSLDSYIERMKEGQDTIYYLLGDRLETLRNHPQLEGFKKRGIEVLLFADHVDDFWVNVVSDYKGKHFKSVTKASDDLDKFAGESDAEKDEKADNPQTDILIKMLKEIYGEQVKDVRKTAKLAESPVCLAVGEGDMDIRMERFLRENKQLPDTAYAKILEINPDHAVIQALAQAIGAKGRNPETEDMAWLLLDQARIIEGEELADPAAFSRRLTKFLAKGMAA